jgi:hypothetical protein
VPASGQGPGQRQNDRWVAVVRGAQHLIVAAIASLDGPAKSGKGAARSDLGVAHRAGRILSVEAQPGTFDVDAIAGEANHSLNEDRGAIG